MSKDDDYPGVPFDLRPTPQDAVALTHILIDVKQAIQIRHDFHNANADADFFTRRLREPVLAPWESSFANGNWPGARTKAGLVAEHQRLAKDAQEYAAKMHGNRKLARLARENVSSLFPPVGYSPKTGDTVKRLVREDKSALRLFNPVGVGDLGVLIRLLVRRPGELFYW
jgi:hypothetical protein